MAFLRANPNNSGLRGRLAGQIYAADGADTVIREFVKSAYNPSEAQLAQEERFTDGSDGWGRLTDLERAAWDQAALSVMSKDPRRIRPRSIQGRSLYIGRIAKILQAGGTVLPTAPPAERFEGEKLLLTLTVQPGQLVVGCPEQGNSANVRTEIRVARLSVAYAKPQPSDYRTKRFVRMAAKDSVSVPVTPGSYSVIVQSVSLISGEIAGTRVLGKATVSLSVSQGVDIEEARAA